jgi:hypothetical protein
MISDLEAEKAVDSSKCLGIVSGHSQLRTALCADGAATILAVGRCSVKVLRLDPGRKFAQFAVAETVLRADDDGVDPVVDFGYVAAVMESWQRMMLCHRPPENVSVSASNPRTVQGTRARHSTLIRRFRSLDESRRSLTENTNFGTQLQIGFLSGETIVFKMLEFENLGQWWCEFLPSWSQQPIIRHIPIPSLSLADIIFCICSCIALRCSTSLVKTAAIASSFLSAEALFISATSLSSSAS